MSETTDNPAAAAGPGQPSAALAADVESALEHRRSRSAAAIPWIREAALVPVLGLLLLAGVIGGEASAE